MEIYCFKVLIYTWNGEILFEGRFDILKIYIINLKATTEVTKQL